MSARIGHYRPADNPGKNDKHACEAQSLSSGIGKTIRWIDDLLVTAPKQVLATVYGYPNSGKTFLIDLIREHYQAHGIPVFGFAGGTPRAYFEEIAASPTERPTLSLFHYGSPRVRPDSNTSTESEDDPALITRDVLGREIDLSILIFNPNIMPPSRENFESHLYNIVIRNDRSVEKRLWGK